MTLHRALQSAAALVLAVLLVVLAFGSGVVAVAFLHTRATHAPLATVFPRPITLPDSALTAKAAILYDPTDGRILYAKNAQAPLPLASLAKLMTAEVALNHLSPDTPVHITQADLEPSGDWGLRPGDVLPLSDLLRLGLIASSNDAMAAAAAQVGSHYLDTMNKTASDMGLTKTHFLNPTGLDVNSGAAGAYGSAYDIARLAAAFFKQYPQYFSLTTNQKVSVVSGGRTLSAAATAAPLRTLPGFIGAKTGYTDLAGGNLVVLFDIEIGHPLVAVVLGSTEKARFDDINTLVHAIRNNQH